MTTAKDVMYRVAHKNWKQLHSSTND